MDCKATSHLSLCRLRELVETTNHLPPCRPEKPKQAVFVVGSQVVGYMPVAVILVQLEIRLVGKELGYLRGGICSQVIVWVSSRSRLNLSRVCIRKFSMVPDKMINTFQ